MENLQSTPGLEMGSPIHLFREMQVVACWPLGCQSSNFAFVVDLAAWAAQEWDEGFEALLEVWKKK